MDIGGAVRAFLDHRRTKNLSEKSIDRYAKALQLWQRWRTDRSLVDDFTTVDADEFRAFLLYLLYEHVPHLGSRMRAPARQRGLAPATVVSMRTVLRALWLFAVGEGWADPAQANIFRGDRIPRPIVEEGDRGYWDDDLVDALLEAAAAGPWSPEQIARSRLIVLLVYESGLRLAELCDLTDEIVNVDDASARIIGKGRKRRWVFWEERATQALRAYLAVRTGPPGGPLLRSLDHRNVGAKLHPDSVRVILKDLAKRAGVELPKQAPIHAGRHGFAHAMIDGGAEISQVAQLMGHSDVRTTMRYLRERPDRLREIHRLAYQRRPRLRH